MSESTFDSEIDDVLASIRRIVDENKVVAAQDDAAAREKAEAEARAQAEAEEKAKAALNLKRFVLMPAHRVDLPEEEAQGGEIHGDEELAVPVPVGASAGAGEGAEVLRLTPAQKVPALAVGGSVSRGGAVRELVSQALAQELDGALGEKIQAMVSDAVREEVRRAMSAPGGAS